MEGLKDFLFARAQGDLLPWSAQVEATQKFAMSLSEIEEAALELNLLPARYQRNRRTISTSQQLKLFRSRVAVIGCGGLGGYIIEELARLGVGHIKAIDPDVFEEHNLNRQLLSTALTLGTPKVSAAEARVKEINPAVELIPVMLAFTKANGPELLRGVDVSVDGLDSVPARIELADACGALGIPLIHGTIGGWYGQITTQFPGEHTVQKIYQNCRETKGMEKTLGNPAFTPAIVASLQVAEVCKVLLGEGTPLRGRMLFINIFDMEINEIKI